jgi:GT2 family glycosyltransferase
VPRELFCRLGGFNTDLVNRFEDVDFCLRVHRAGLRICYSPHSIGVQSATNWHPTAEQDRTNCFRFYARWTGALWQDDDHYLKEDGLERDSLSALYRGLAARIAAQVQEVGVELAQ